MDAVAIGAARDRAVAALKEIDEELPHDPGGDAVRVWLLATSALLLELSPQRMAQAGRTLVPLMEQAVSEGELPVM